MKIDSVVFEKDKVTWRIITNRGKEYDLLNDFLMGYFLSDLKSKKKLRKVM